MMRPEVPDDESLQCWDYRRDDQQFLTASWPPQVLQVSSMSSIDNGSAATTATESVYGAPTQRPDDNPESDGGRLDETAMNDLSAGPGPPDASNRVARQPTPERHLPPRYDVKPDSPQSAVTKRQLAHKNSDKRQGYAIWKLKKPLPDQGRTGKRISTTQQLRKSCDRCHKQKIRCAEGQAGGVAEGGESSLARPVVTSKSCARCVKAGADCKYSSKGSRLLSCVPFSVC